MHPLLKLQYLKTQPRRGFFRQPIDTQRWSNANKGTTLLSSVVAPSCTVTRENGEQWTTQSHTAGRRRAGQPFWQRLAASAKTQDTHDTASPLHRTHPWKRQNKVRKVTRNNLLGAMTHNNKNQCPPTFDGYVNCHETERHKTTWIL